MQERAVIIVGASADPARYANKAVRAYLEGGYTVYPVHPRLTIVEGLRCHPSIADVPAPAETLLLYVNPEVGLLIIDQAAGKGVREVFVNPGAGSPELVARIRALGMEPIEGCAILAIGASPDRYPG